jgi:hypothetical protein
MLRKGTFLSLSAVEGALLNICLLGYIVANQSVM